MLIPEGKTPDRFSWHDYKEWPEDERWQIIDGQAYCMTAAPNIKHQKVTILTAISAKRKYVVLRMCRHDVCAPRVEMFNEHRQNVLFG